MPAELKADVARGAPAPEAGRTPARPRPRSPAAPLRWTVPPNARSAAVAAAAEGAGPDAARTWSSNSAGARPTAAECSAREVPDGNPPSWPGPKIPLRRGRSQPPDVPPPGMVMFISVRL